MSAARLLSIPDAMRDCHVAQDSIEAAVEQVFAATTGEVSPFDLLFAGTANRSHCLVDSFELLINQNMLIAALPLIRLQLDSLLRLFALELVDKPLDVAVEILKGKKLSQVKDRSNQQLRDGYLHQEFSKKYGDVSTTYDDTSAFVHLSDVHIRAACLFDPATRKTQVFLDGRIADPTNTAIMAANNFLGATGTLSNLFEIWRKARLGV